MSAKLKERLRRGLEVGVAASASKVVGCQDVGAGVGAGFEQIDIGMLGIVTCHAPKVAMSTPNSAGVGKIEHRNEACPG